MKISKVIWFVVGGIVLIGLGFALGFHVPFRGAAVLHPMMTAGGFRGGFPFLMLGVRGLFGLISCIGPLAGIAALIIVLSRRPAVSSAPAASAAPAPMPEASASPTEASSKTSAKSK
jgi:hypothetical protein